MSIGVNNGYSLKEESINTMVIRRKYSYSQMTSVINTSGIVKEGGYSREMIMWLFIFIRMKCVKAVMIF